MFPGNHPISPLEASKGLTRLLSMEHTPWTGSADLPNLAASARRRHGGFDLQAAAKDQVRRQHAPSNTKVAASSFQSLLIFKDWRTRPADLVNSRGTKHILVFQVATVTCAWPLSYRSRSVLETVQSPIWIQDCQYYYSLRI